MPTQPTNFYQTFRIMTGQLVLVTGVTGFIAGHVANELLEKGYRVRGTTRGAKVKLLTDAVKVPGLEFAQVDDIAKSDLTEALNGVHIVMHVASPLPGRTSVDTTLNSAVEGTLNVLRQADKAGIEKIVVTSSVAAILDPSLKQGFDGRILTDSDWGQATRAEVEAHADSDFYVYGASKIFAERAVWSFAAEHPKVDIATILPGFVFGPFPKHFPLPTSPDAMGTNRLPYELIKGGHPEPAPWVVDVRDIAKAHVLAIELPRAPLEKKRFLINAAEYSWKDAVAHLMKARPNVKLAPLDSFEGKSPTLSALDTTRAREVLKIKQFISPEKTLEDTTDALLEAEKTWKKA